ncbi:unnamed protein product [Trypanosoma congolense IL3000]|uniref:WGS project CAEQ00000000 data, annotated contig 1757 n=1 Tax=Trypanosoma congolense (strain IL3000) TaxID=1068625 RepID=F9W8P5_TRYCI|nr:unnamed protein product [Trypanosoma congolense IL3000]
MDTCVSKLFACQFVLHLRRSVECLGFFKMGISFLPTRKLQGYSTLAGFSKISTDNIPRPVLKALSKRLFLFEKRRKCKPSDGSTNWVLQAGAFPILGVKGVARVINYDTTVIPGACFVGDICAFFLFYWKRTILSYFLACVKHRQSIECSFFLFAS